MQVLLAASPILVVIVLMAGFNIASKIALPIGLGVAMIVAVFYWGVEVTNVLAFSLFGAFRAIDIILIILGAIVILNTLKASGAMDTISRVSTRYRRTGTCRSSLLPGCSELFLRASRVSVLPLRLLHHFSSA